MPKTPKPKRTTPPWPTMNNGTGCGGCGAAIPADEPDRMWPGWRYTAHMPDCPNTY